MALNFALAFPYGPAFADRITKGDYINLYAIFDITYPRLKRTTFLGTRWGDEDAKLIPAPGDPWYLNYSYNPLSLGVAPPPPEAVPPPQAAPGEPMPPVSGPLLPYLPQPSVPLGGPAPVTTSSQIFAGPYGAEAPPAPAGTRTGRWWLMLTRFVRNQLIIFTIASVIGVAVMMFAYMQVPTLLGVGRLTVKLELPASGGLYRFSNVTYRGVQIGRVTGVALTENGAEATMSLDTSPKIPADLAAEVRSVSAVGEQYVDLRPRTDSGPYLRDGSVIGVENTTIPQQVGPMLDQVSSLVKSIPKDRLSDLLDESFKAFNGAGDDFQSLLDSSASISQYLNEVSDQSRALIDDSGPLLDSQAKTTDAIRTWARSVAGISDEVAKHDADIRTILQRGPGFADELSALLNQLKPTLPVLLSNLTTLGQIFVTYNPSLEQLLVLLPGTVALQQSFGIMKNNPYGLPLSDFCASPSAIRRHAPSVSCRRRSGDHRPTRPPSTLQMGCTASCPRMHRSAYAAPATCRAWGTPGSVRPRLNCATTPRGISR